MLDDEIISTNSLKSFLERLVNKGYSSSVRSRGLSKLNLFFSFSNSCWDLFKRSWTSEDFNS
jgi:hypothetical protein